ncbi:MAG: GAF domain-containing protein, partial [Bacteroidota bacterium]|nr:GAF domain-containing protein [Bacteroidota bacterium]
MRRFSIGVVLYLIIDTALLVFCFSHIPSIVSRAAAPFEVDKKDTSVVVSRIRDGTAASALHAGDILLTWNEHAVCMPEIVEFLGDISAIGDSVQISFERQHTVHNTQIILVQFYSSYRYVVIITFVGIIIWALAIYILLNGGSSLLANVLHWMMICFSVVVMITWGAISPSSWQSYVARTLFFLSYTIGPVLFLFFTMTYARPPTPRLGMKAAGIGAVALFFAAILLYFHLTALSQLSLEQYRLFQKAFDYFHGFLLVSFGVGIYNIIHSYRIAASSDDRRRLQWLLWGFSIGFIPFLLLYILPQLFYSEYLIQEEYTTIFFLVIPFSFTLSFVKYRFLDIEVVIRRSIIYSVLSVFVLITYLLVVLLTTSLIEGKAIFKDYLLVVLLTLAIAAFINPARIKIQHIIDATLFTAKTNFRNALMQVNKQLRSALSADDLFQLLARSIKTLLPVEWTTAFKNENGSLVLQSSTSVILPHSVSLTKKAEALCIINRALAAEHAINFSRNDVAVSPPSADSLVNDLSASACVPIITKSNTVLGVLALRLRAPHDQFTEEEIDLVIAL